MARIEWTEEAVRDLKVIDKQVGLRILKKLSWFSENFETGKLRIMRPRVGVGHHQKIFNQSLETRKRNQIPSSTIN